MWERATVRGGEVRAQSSDSLVDEAVQQSCPNASVPPPQRLRRLKMEHEGWRGRGECWKCCPRGRAARFYVYGSLRRRLWSLRSTRWCSQEGRALWCPGWRRMWLEAGLVLLIDLQRKQRRVGAQETSSEFLWELAAAARGLLQHRWCSVVGAAGWSSTNHQQYDDAGDAQSHCSPVTVWRQDSEKMLHIHFLRAAISNKCMGTMHHG